MQGEKEREINIPRTIIEMERVSVVFGNNPAAALPLMDSGKSREEIREKTGQILGAHDCTLQVREGEIVVLMGLSGSGKSTLLRAVNGLVKIARGTVRVDDGKALADIGDADEERLRFFRRRRIAMVFQQFALLPWRTVAENIAFGLEVAGIDEETRRARVEKQLRMVHLEGWGGRRVSELSGGMQQRVGLARAFATESPILLMDEPFSALDPLIRAKLQDELMQLQKQLRRTIVFVSHDLDEAMRIGSRIAIMEGGRIVQTGAPHEIVNAPATANVEDFVAHINPMKILRARDIMRPLPDDEKQESDNATSATLPADTPLPQVLQTKRTTKAPIIITNETGTPTGTITDADIYAALLKNKRQKQ
ncbi:MAG: choline ABC transporter ATP-binding protein [Gammaproteobacteria bacterium]